MYTKETFTDLFTENEIILNEEYQKNLSESLVHTGQLASIDFVARL